MGSWSAGWVLGLVGVLLVVWRSADWLWWRPRRLERALRAQGLRGNPYRFFHGDLKETARLSKEARSEPINPPSHRVIPRLLPHLHRSINHHGKISFTWVGPTPRVSIMDPELVREVLSNKFGHFEKTKASPIVKLLATGLANYNGEKWVKHRRIINPAFHLEKLKMRPPQHHLNLQIRVGVAVIVIVVILMYYLKSQNHPIRRDRRKKEAEREMYMSRIIRGTASDMIKQVRMSHCCFMRLCELLREHGGLRDTIHVSVEEQVVLFLHTVGHNVRTHVVAHRFVRSSETANRYFHIVLQSILKLYPLLVVQPLGDKCPKEINDTRRFFPYFKDCIGAIDGTHIPCSVPLEDQARFRGRKGRTTQNVLAACTFDLKFTYILAGWEGSAHDAMVLRDALNRIGRLLVPEGKYYLVDAGYKNQPGFLAPYRSTRYHLNEWQNRTPETAQELFNLRHSSLRNAIERCFGILKKRFPILKVEVDYSIDTQINIVIACCVLHNHIMGMDPADDITRKALASFERQQVSQMDQDSQITDQQHRQRRNDWASFRDNLATQMYKDYVR